MSLTSHLDRMPTWVRDMAIPIIGDVGMIFGISALNNIRGKGAKQVTNQDLDRAHAQMSEVDQTRIRDVVKAITEYSEMVNASSEPEDVKKRKIEEFSKNLLSTLSAGKKDGDKAKEVEPKDFNGVLKVLDEQTMLRFRAWYDALDEDDKKKFDTRQNEVTVEILKSAMMHFELSGEIPEPEQQAGRFSNMIADLNPDQMARYQTLFNALTAGEQDSLEDAGDRMPKKIFLAELERVVVPKKRESEDFCAFRASLDEALGNRYDLFDKNLSSSDRTRLNAFRTWLTKDALRTWLPTVTNCDAASATLALEQLEQYAKELQAVHVAAFGHDEAAKILRRLRIGLVPVVAVKAAATPAERDSVKVKKVLAYIIGRLKPPAKPLGEVVKEIKDKVEAMTGGLEKIFHPDKAKGHAVDPASLPPMKKTENKQLYLKRLLADVNVKNVKLEMIDGVEETEEQLEARLRSAIEHKDAQRKTRIKKWLESGRKLETLPD